MVKYKELSIEIQAQTEIMSKEGYSQRMIAKILKLSRHVVQYMLKRKQQGTTLIEKEQEGKRQ